MPASVCSRGGLDPADLAHVLAGRRLDLFGGGLGIEAAEGGDVPAHVIRLRLRRPGGIGYREVAGGGGGGQGDCWGQWLGAGWAGSGDGAGGQCPAGGAEG